MLVNNQSVFASFSHSWSSHLINEKDKVGGDDKLWNVVNIGEKKLGPARRISRLKKEKVHLLMRAAAAAGWPLRFTVVRFFLFDLTRHQNYVYTINLESPKRNTDSGRQHFFVDLYYKGSHDGFLIVIVEISEWNSAWSRCPIGLTASVSGPRPYSQNGLVAVTRNK